LPIIRDGVILGGGLNTVSLGLTVVKQLGSTKFNDLHGFRANEN